MLCAMFAADAVLAMTGEDYAKAFRKHKTETGALRKLRKMGFNGHVDYVSSLFPEVATAAAGDLVVLADDALGVSQGQGFAYAVGIDGRVGLRPASDIKRSFRV